MSLRKNFQQKNTFQFRCKCAILFYYRKEFCQILQSLLKYYNQGKRRRKHVISLKFISNLNILHFQRLQKTRDCILSQSYHLYDDCNHFPCIGRPFNMHHLCFNANDQEHILLFHQSTVGENATV